MKFNWNGAGGQVFFLCLLLLGEEEEEREEAQEVEDGLAEQGGEEICSDRKLSNV